MSLLRCNNCGEGMGAEQFCSACGTKQLARGGAAAAVVALDQPLLAPSSNAPHAVGGFTRGPAGARDTYAGGGAVCAYRGCGQPARAACVGAVNADAMHIIKCHTCGPCGYLCCEWSEVYTGHGELFCNDHLMMREQGGADSNKAVPQCPDHQAPEGCCARQGCSCCY